MVLCFSSPRKLIHTLCQIIHYHPKNYATYASDQEAINSSHRKQGLDYHTPSKESSVAHPASLHWTISDTMAQSVILATREAEAKGSQVQGQCQQPRPHIKI